MVDCLENSMEHYLEYKMGKNSENHLADLTAWRMAAY